MNYLISLFHEEVKIGKIFISAVQKQSQRKLKLKEKNEEIKK